MTVVENTTQNHHDDLLWRQLKTIPAFRALLRAVESRFYQQIDLPGPVLDVGCGDGHFAQMTFDKKLTVGIDPWWGPLNKAKRSEMYEVVLQGMGDKMPFPDASFSSAISNSVLEHIPDIQPVLNEISRVLKPGGKLVITMPSHLFTQNLGGAALLRPFGLSAHYQKFFNFISRHAHTDSAEVWTARLAQAGFAVEQWQYYFSTGALRALEWGHVQGLPSAVMHFLTGKWILGPYESNLWPAERWIRPFYEEPFPEEGAYVIFVARKVANQPIQATLPEKRPFSNQESTLPKPTEEINEWLAAAENHLFEPAPPTPLPSPSLLAPHSSPAPSPLVSLSPFFSLGLLFLSLLCAVIGQSILSSSVQEPAGGLRWFGYSLIGFLAAMWWRHSAELPPLFTWQLPRLADISRQRWFYGLGFLASLFAYRQVANPTAQHPTLALLFWLIGIGLSWYALNDSQPLLAFRFSFFASRSSLLTALGLFAAALVVRFWSLTTHPFILNGTEASIGLDVLNVSRGLLNNPFGTGWLTNPTLPYYLMQIPLRILGPTVLGIRFLSPIIGALTVVAVYWVGKRLWNKEVGLISAVLLLGSHLHLQYSRLGVTNIWDPLAALLALGLVAVAWERGKEVSSEQSAMNSRQRWLVAGTAVGLNAYLYTSSHLLPIMLIILLGLVLLFHRPAFYQQARHIFAAALLAIVIILPQWLYYNNNPTIFMERANNLGILDSQSGWLNAEAQRTSIPASDILRQQVLKAALAFNYSLDTSPSYRPGVPLLTFGPSVLLIIGLMVALFHLRQLRYQLLLVWFAVTIIFGGVLLIEPPSSHRLVILAPAVALLGAVALVEVGKWVMEVAGGRWPVASEEESEARGVRSARQGVLVVLVVMAVLFSLNEMVFYFGRYRTQHTFADRNTEIADELSDYLNSLDGGWTAYFFGPPSMYVGFPTIPFLVQDFQAGVNLFDVNTPGEKLPVASNPNQVFIFLPERSGELAEIKTAYPGGTERAIAGFYANPLFVVYEVEP